MADLRARIVEQEQVLAGQMSSPETISTLNVSGSA
jgi:hypothetical protein